MDSLSVKIKKGYFWVLMSSLSSQMLSFGIGIVLARTLHPEDFGIFAAIMIITEVASTLVSSGFVSVLLQRQETRSEHFSTAFILALITGVAVCLTLIGIAPWVGSFYHNNSAGNILRILSFNFLMLPFSSIPSAILRRQMKFHTIMTTDMSQMIAQGGTSIILAIYGFGVWSLVWGRLAGHLVMSIHLMTATGWFPKFRCDLQSGKDLISLGIQFSTKNILNDIASNIDYLIVGRYLGLEQLGYYSRAYYLMTLPVSRLSTSVGIVLFPAFAKIQDDHQRILSGLIKATCGISLISFPVLIGLYLVAPSFIHVVYGEKWTATVLPLQIMCLGGLFYAIEPVAVSVIHAKGYIMSEILRQCIYLLLLITGVYLGSSWGIAGVAYAVLFVSFSYWLMLQFLLKKIILLPLKDYYNSLGPAAIACIFMFVIVRFYQFWVGPYFHKESLMLLLSSVSLGMISYSMALLVLRSRVKHPLVLEVFAEIEGRIVSMWSKLTQWRMIESPRI